MHDGKPSISVAMATYNGERYLEEQLASLACQTTLPLELQVGDDGSTDRTVEILESFARTAPFPVHITQNANNLGCSENFMATARRCSGDWIMFSDQDDVWFPSKLQRCLQIAMESGPETMLVAHNATVTDEQLKPGNLLSRGPFGTFSRLTLNPKYLAHGFRLMFRRLPIIALPTEGRRLGWLPNEEAHDNWVSVIASILGTVVETAEPLAFYRRHDQTLTQIWRPQPVEISRAILTNNSDVYEFEGDEVQQLAAYFEMSATMVPEFASEFKAAARESMKYARALQHRAALFRAGNRRKRLRTFLAMAREGSYSASNRWRLGLRNMAKDAFFAVM